MVLSFTAVSENKYKCSQRKPSCQVSLLKTEDITMVGSTNNEFFSRPFSWLLGLGSILVHFLKRSVGDLTFVKVIVVFKSAQPKPNQPTSEGGLIWVEQG